MRKKQLMGLILGLFMAGLMSKAHADIIAIEFTYNITSITDRYGNSLNSALGINLGDYLHVSLGFDSTSPASFSDQVSSVYPNSITHLSVQSVNNLGSSCNRVGTFISP